MHHDRDERGTFLVIWALLIVAIFTMLAIVIDLGQVRETRREVQSTADFAALAAGPAMSKENPRQACLDAVTYIRTNSSGLPAIANPCTSFPTTVTGCSNTSPAATTWATTADPYTLQVQWPVPDANIVDPHFVAKGERDGQPCERLLVSLSRWRPTFFGGIVGTNRLTAHATAVVRATSGSPHLTPTLWLLDPDGCGPNGGAGSLVVSGGATVKVGSSTSSGIITLDSNGSLCGNSGSSQRTTVGTDGGSSITAIGPTGGSTSLNLFATPVGATPCNPSAYHDCDPADLLSPPPVPLRARSTRAPVDWVYDCRIGYPPFPDLTGSLKVTVEDCPHYGSVPPYVTNLVSAVNAAGVTSVPSGYTRLSDWARTNHVPHPCNPSSVDIPKGNWYVDCAGHNTSTSSGGFVVNGSGTTVRFLGGNVVFQGDVSVGPNASLSFNSDLSNPGSLPTQCRTPVNPPDALSWTPCTTSWSKNAAFVFMRSGGNLTGGGNVELDHTFVYQMTSDPTSPFATDGYLSTSGNITWTAPTEGPFAGLALWSEAQNAYGLGGGGAINVVGVFFTPRADYFTISGNAGEEQLQAQFVSYDFKVTGTASFVMSPPGDFPLQIQPPAFTLIR